MKGIFGVLFRKKTIDLQEQGTELKRVLGLGDLTFLGLGVTLGLGTYVLPGSVAKIHAGPAVCISFLIAAIASGLAGLCYAEFACRVPKAGSAYIYSYVTMGEFAAFIIGWCLIMEYVIGIAGLARGLSDYIDALANNTVSRTLREAMPIDVDFISSYPDLLALGIILILIVIMSFGAKESTMLNNILTGANILIVAAVIGFGAFFANVDFWNISEEDIPEGVKGGVGGFVPFGFAGILTGAAQCFFAFVGFDAVATTADEAKNPKKMIPLAIVLCLVISFLSYFGISTVLTLMRPYYDQDEKAPFPGAFNYVDKPSGKFLATAGALFAMTSTLVAGMFALPRILYSMARDGLLFRPLSRVSKRSKTPFVATIATGMFSGLMAMIFNVNQLVEMLSIGTLVAYAIVSLCVLILRHRPNDEDATVTFNNGRFRVIKLVFNLNRNKVPSRLTSHVTNWSILSFCALAVVVCTCAKQPALTSLDYPYRVVIFAILILALLVSMMIITRQPEQDSDITFKVPLVPLIPCSSIFINIMLMSTSNVTTYIRLIVWLTIGLLIYFAYGIRHSKERKTTETENAVCNKDIFTKL